MKQLVFVFGTLKEGFPNFATNQGVRIPGAFVTRERYPLYLVGERCSPWLVDQPGEGARVCGQVFEVDEAALAAMDALERVTEPDGYRRVAIEVVADGAQGGPTLRPFVYLKPAQHFDPSQARLGPLGEYTLEHVARYRPRAAYGLTGQCHCGNIHVAMQLTREPTSYAPRACDCDFCRQHGAAYLSDPQGKLAIQIRDSDGVSRYRQGSGTAEFVLCRHCGVLVAVTCLEDGHLYAAVNSRAVGAGHAGFAAEVPVSPKTLSVDQKLARWTANWFADVTIDAEPLA
ncbi:MAG: gamma-glutamylcyclotransferase [Burkholderiales bacterium]|nr:gamma-glutamylcyclotransferase [Burkholderiales bacterium]